MIYDVFISPAAQLDILELHNFLCHEVSAPFALTFVDEIEEKIDSLFSSPERGHLPPELTDSHDRTIREIHYKSFRIFYEIFDTDIVILAVADGRRDIRELLQRRLFRS